MPPPDELDRALDDAREAGEHFRQADHQMTEARERVRAHRAKFAALLDLGEDIALGVLEAVVVLGAKAAMAELQER